MPKFRIMCEIKAARGWQAWTVEAANEEEAFDKHRAGESEFDEQEVDVMDLHEPEIEQMQD